MVSEEQQKRPIYSSTSTSIYASTYSNAVSNTDNNTEKDIGILAEEIFLQVKDARDFQHLPNAEKILREAVEKSKINRKDNLLTLE